MEIGKRTHFLERADAWGEAAIDTQAIILRYRRQHDSGVDLCAQLATCMYWRNSNIWDHMDRVEAD